MYKNVNITKCNKKIILFHKLTGNVFSVREKCFLIAKDKIRGLIYLKKIIYNIFETLGKKHLVIRRIL